MTVSFVDHKKSSAIKTLSLKIKQKEDKSIRGIGEEDGSTSDKTRSFNFSNDGKTFDYASDEKDKVLIKEYELPWHSQGN